MILETQRLELVPLLPYQLKLWIEDRKSLERDTNCSYKAEPVEGFFLEIVKGQLQIVERNPGDYIIAETDIDGFASQRILRHCGFEVERQGETIWWKL